MSNTLASTNNSPTILLTTLNARFAHTAIGLRYLYANMQHLQGETEIMEFTINDALQDIAEKIVARNPKIIGIGVYIWNVRECAILTEIIKKVSPQTHLIIGGPEVSYNPLRIEFPHVDYIIQGEADLAFYQLAQTLLAGIVPTQTTIHAAPVDMATLALPYDFYSDADIAHRYIYIEASRGCPFRCEFCLSSIANQVRNVETEHLRIILEKLWQRGARNFKFIDRTFNLNIKIAGQLLDFFLSKSAPYFLHFEVIPDHFPEALKNRLAQFPAGALQLEIGIQTLNATVAERISRPLKRENIDRNITFLDTQTQAHMHLDLIVGLPGETIESFANGLNELYALSHSEIQIGILKKLSGTSLHRHDDQFGMVYSDQPPYDILQNHQIDFHTMQKIKRFARFWDLYYNRGNFKETLPLLWHDGDVFGHFYAFSQWLYAQTESTWKISLERLAEYLFQHLAEQHPTQINRIGATMIHDLMKHGDRKMPGFLKPYSDGRYKMGVINTALGTTPTQAKLTTGTHNKRQKRHQ